LRFEIAVLDPPYDAAQEYENTLNSAGHLLSEGAIVIAEHRRKIGLRDRYSALFRFRVLEQGDAALSFYKYEQSLESSPEN
jgi:16S rRNA G966 N2-methylase RsmD